VRRGAGEGGPSRASGAGWRHDAVTATRIDFNIQAPIVRRHAVQVDGRRYFHNWKTDCTLGNADPSAAAYQAGTLPRTDQYLYSRISRDSKHGISTPKGSWLEHCLTFHSGELAAKLTINLPKSALERGEITAAEIEKIARD
jgi:hypothetical protein